MPTLYLDTETFNPLGGPSDLGTYRYAETCEVMLVTYAIDDGPVECWDVTEVHEAPLDLAAALADPRTELPVVAHHAMFDRNALRLGNLRINVPIERWRCTMVQAYQHALPGSLDELGALLGLPEDARKLADGKKLIQLFCKPLPANRKLRRATRETHPAEWERFKAYAMQDVTAMREIHKRLPTWNWKPADTAEWHLDQHINDRGFAVDLDLVRAGAEAAEREKAQLAGRFGEITGGLAPTQRARVQEHLAERYGLHLEATAKHVMEPLSRDATQPAEVREIAQIMLAANKTSTAKYGALLDAVSADGRFRGGLQFSGAARTRRWAGRVFQPQNLPSRGLPKQEAIEAYIEALKAGAHDLLFDDLMLYGAAALRGVVVASEEVLA